jgi:hypothetical protein
MEKIINVAIKQVYGRPLVYVKSAHNEPIRQLTGRNTLTPGDITALKSLGYSFQEVPATNLF